MSPVRTVHGLHGVLRLLPARHVQGRQPRPCRRHVSARRRVRSLCHPRRRHIRHRSVARLWCVPDRHGDPPRRSVSLYHLRRRYSSPRVRVVSKQVSEVYYAVHRHAKSRVRLTRCRLTRTFPPAKISSHAFFLREVTHNFVRRLSSNMNYIEYKWLTLSMISVRNPYSGGSMDTA